jgi:hypothetical protein
MMVRELVFVLRLVRVAVELAVWVLTLPVVDGQPVLGVRV